MNPIALILYALLGFIAFLAPRVTREVKATLNFLDAISTMLLVLLILVNALRLRVEEVETMMNSFTIDSLSATTCYFVYLLCANFSRCYWLGKCSVNRIIAYFTAIIMLTSITILLQRILIVLA